RPGREDRPPADRDSSVRPRPSSSGVGVTIAAPPRRRPMAGTGSVPTAARPIGLVTTAGPGCRASSACRRGQDRRRWPTPISSELRLDRRQASLNLLEGLLELGHRGAGSDQLLQFDELLLEVLGVSLDWGPRGRLLEQRQREADAVAVTAQVS